MKKLHLAEARATVINAQGLSNNTQFKNDKAKSLSVIKHLSYVQIDTISVVERAHHHILWSRNPAYRLSDLDQLTNEKKIFEYWSHAAAYLPIEDYRFSLPRKKRHADGDAHWFKITPEHLKQKKIILERFKSEGPLQSKDFEKPKNSKPGWFNYSVSKQMLTKLFMDGVLMVSKRQGFQKVYDLTERVLPQNINTDFPTDAEMARYLIQSCLRSHAFATEKEIGFQRQAELRNLIKGELKKMIIEGEVIEIKIAENQNSYFALFNVLDQKLPKTKSTMVKILSPFDNLVIQRQRLVDIFNFNYQIECYTPEKSRKYGYFSLPLLYKNNLVGLVDLKAHRSKQTLEVRTMFGKNEYYQDDDFQEALMKEIKIFAVFNGCEKVIGFKKMRIYK